MPGTYLKGLNSLRFIAAMMVFAAHGESFRRYIGLPAFWTDVQGTFLGSLGVTIFFVLSGFLITYLLLLERERTGRISVRDFFVRRILRIWPLYFGMVWFAFFIAPHLPWLYVPGYTTDIHAAFWQNLLLFVGMMPNVAMVFLPGIPLAGVLWSVGVEEQFYAFWPFLWNAKMPRLRLLLGIVLGVVGARLCCVALMYKGPADVRPFMLHVVEWLTYTRISCMAIGGMGAYLVAARGALAGKGAARTWLFSRPIQAASLALFLALAAVQWVWSNAWTGLIVDEALSFPLMVLIVNMACNERPLLGLEIPWMGRLGKISYGIYVYHSLCLIVCLRLSGLWGLGITARTALLYGTALGLTIVVSRLSYRYVEKPFLRLKRSYERV
jgi:peptidoglycan/LPS O-acetylase OafA/YrhL